MPSYAGSSLYLEWIHSGGTTLLNTDYRTFTYTPTIDFYDGTAGADTARERISGLKDGSMSFAGVQQAAGTAIITALAEGVSGTLRWSPEGTATGKGKYTAPAISLGVKWNIPYNDIVEISADWQQNGARTDSAW